MYFIQYILMCAYIATYLYFQLTNTPMPAQLPLINTGIACAFLAWGGFWSIRVIVDCIRLRAKNQMTVENMRKGMLLAVLNFLPNLGMSGFMLLEGYR